MHSDGFQPSFEGRFSDGNSAASETVDVRLGKGGIEITRRSADTAAASPPAPLVWPYGALAVAQPLAGHAIDVLVSYAHQPGATLFVPSGTFARALAEAAPHLTVGRERWRHARPWILASALVGLAAALVAIGGLTPARTVAGLLPDKIRVKLGEQTIAAMTEGKAKCEAPAGRAALDLMTRRLSDAAGGARPFDVVVVNWGLVNAFAAPGERIVLTRGLIAQAESAEEVAGVLAHEMGHGLELHPETGFVRAIGLAAATELMLGGGGGTMANIGLVLVQIAYTRGAEADADTQAIRIMKGARVAPAGLAQFFRRLLKKEGAGTRLKVPDVLSTHPPSEERARRMEASAGYATTPILSESQWKALKAICTGVAPEAD